MDSEWYSVHVETRAPTGALDLSVDENAADALMDFLEEHDGVVSYCPGSWEVTISVKAFDVHDAAAHGAALIGVMAAKAGMPHWPQVRAEVILQDILDAVNPPHIATFLLALRKAIHRA